MDNEEDETTKRIKNFIEKINVDDAVSIRVIGNSLLDSISNTTQMSGESTKRRLKDEGPPRMIIR
jgi:hypothetical protein